MGQPLGSSGGAYIQFSPATRERPTDPFELHGREVADSELLQQAEKAFLEGNWEGALTQKQIDQRSIVEKGMKIGDDRAEAFLERYNRNELISYSIPGSGEKLQIKMAPNKKELKNFNKDLSKASSDMLKALKSGDKSGYIAAKKERTNTVTKFLKQVSLPHRVSMTQTAYNKLRDVVNAHKKLRDAVKSKDYAAIKKIDLNKIGVDKKFAKQISRYSDAAKINKKTGKVTTRAVRELNRMRAGKVAAMQALSLKQLNKNIKSMEKQLSYTKAKALTNGLNLKENKLSGKVQVEKATNKVLKMTANSFNKALNTNINPKNLQLSERQIKQSVRKVVSTKIKSNSKSDLNS